VSTESGECQSRVKLLQHFGGKTSNRTKSYSENINKIINEVSDQSQPLWKNSAEKKGISITFETDLEKTENIKVNDTGIKSALYNLIKNSVEAIVKEGKIKIETEILNNNVIIRIIDTGKGMDEETRSRIFQPFFSTKGFESGRGMGMSGAYSIIKEHNGEIYVKETLPDKGTTIEISLPISLEDEKKVEPQKIPISKDITKILWVDDDPLIRNLASEILESLGIEGDLTDSGLKALKLLEGKQYDLVITDIGMPGMSGWELCDIINEKHNSKMKIAVVSGWGAEVDEETMEQHGVSYVVEKPFKIKQLQELINKAMQ
jgi:CheY-like chemotaxis protein/anti-sigma regulatory factor (Ser/Thr protein kinase)